MSSQRYWLWLKENPKISTAKANLLLRWFGDPEEVYRADARALRFVEGITEKDIAFLMDKELRNAEEILDSCYNKSIEVVTQQDALYPYLLKNIEVPPLALYVLGNLPDLEREVPIAVVGTRKSSGYAQLAAKKLGYQISRCGGLVVSGMAEGIDARAQEGALLGGGKTIAVLGCGVDIIYPRSSEQLYSDILRWGAVISEYPPGTRVRGEFFPVRNRIISGMCYGTLVVECPAKSGALITAKTALEQGRDVFAVPGTINNANCQGSNSLIREGAILTENGWDIMSQYTYVLPEKVVYRPDETEITLDTKDIPRNEPEAEPKKPENPGIKDEKPRKKPDTKPASQKKVIDKETDRSYIQAIEKLGPDAKAIAEALGDKTRYIDDIIELTQMKAARVLATLTLMQIKGVVTQYPGKKFRLNND